MRNKSLIKNFLFGLIALVFVLTPTVLVAEEYSLLAPIPLSETGSAPIGSTTPVNYLKGVVRLSVAAAAVLAVIMIIFAGIKYMTTEAYQGKGEAKKDIQNAIWGLALAMGAWLILYTVNPDLVRLKIDVPEIEIKGSAIGGELGVDFKDKEEARKQLGCDGCVAVVPVEIDGKLEWPFPTKPPGAACEGKVCFIDEQMFNKLRNLDKTLRSEKNGGTQAEDIPWQVTEMLPPTTYHAHACQRVQTQVTGQCVDVSITDLRCRNANSCGVSPLSRDVRFIKAFIDAASDQSLSVRYEVPSEKRRSDLVGAGIPAHLVIVVPPREDPDCPSCHMQIISEHFSVYLNESVRGFRGN